MGKKMKGNVSRQPHTKSDLQIKTTLAPTTANGSRYEEFETSFPLTWDCGPR